MVKILSLLLITLCLYADRAGPFISLGASASQFNSEVNFVEIENDYASGMSFCAGAYINENLSVALEFNYIGEFITSFSTNTLSVIDVAVLAHLPLFEDKLDLSLKFGAGDLWWQETTQFKRDDTTSALITGLAAAYRINKIWSLKAGVDVYHFAYRKTSSDPTIDLEVAKYYSSLEYQF